MNTLTGPMVLLKKGWELFINHKDILILVAITPTIIFSIAQIFFIYKSLVLSILGILISLVGIVLSISMMPALVNAIHRLSNETGITLSLKTQYSYGVSLFWSTLLVAIIAGLVAVGSYSLLIIPGIIVSGFIGFYTFTFVVDNKRGLSAFTESYSLVKGRWTQVFGRLLVIGLAVVACWLVIALIIQGISFISGMPLSVAINARETAQTTFGTYMSIVMNLVGNGILVPISLGAMYNLYISLKSTRQNEITTSSFKNWLVVFLCMGILVPLVLLVGMILVSLH